MINSARAGTFFLVLFITVSLALRSAWPILGTQDVLNELKTKWNMLKALLFIKKYQ